jgi:hypothetical protein
MKEPTMSNDQILEEVRHLATLKTVLEWSLARSPRAEFVEVVVQDEFHHDVILRVAAAFAVFETT